MGDQTPSGISNIVTNIIVLASAVMNIKSLHGDKNVNTLADYLAKKTYRGNVQLFGLLIIYSIFLVSKKNIIIIMDQIGPTFLETWDLDETRILR